MKEDKSLLANWFNSVKELIRDHNYAKEHRTTTVEGHINHILGPRSHIAGVKLIVDDQASNFSMRCNLPNFNDETKAYAEWAVFGFLDVVLTQSRLLTPLRITIEEMHIDSTNSSQFAFRLAGRKAGIEYLNLQNKN